MIELFILTTIMYVSLVVAILFGFITFIGLFNNAVKGEIWFGWFVIFAISFGVYMGSNACLDEIKTNQAIERISNDK